MLERLIKLLLSYGGKGVEYYLQGSQKEQDFLESNSNKGVSLNLLKKAMDWFSSDKDSERFLYFTRRLKSLPDKEVWTLRSTQLQNLSSVLEREYMQRLYWEILQPLTTADQELFLDPGAAKRVFNIFPSLNALHKFSKEHSSQSLKRLLEACCGLKKRSITKGGIKKRSITKEGIQILFEALLKTNIPLPWSDAIPDHFLSRIYATENDGVEITVSELIPSGKQLALSFIAVLMAELNNILFTAKGRWLEIEELGDGVKIHRFPLPQLEIHDDNIEISNWSEQQFREFLTLIEFPESYYFTEDEWQKQLNSEQYPEQPLYIQRRNAVLAANKEAREQGADEVAPFKPLPIFVLKTLINQNKAINPAVWKSFYHHKGRLPVSILRKMIEKLEAPDTTCPDEMKNTLFDFQDEVQHRGTEECRSVSETEPEGVNTPDNKKEKEAFSSLWLRLNTMEVFDTEILEILNEYRDEIE
ncbi:MAG: hypothetical protein PUP46_01555, partial [Endozoicomonas sp. (ex Botrylloides leachii)]|nr:hypothetical protein [Endozoicomonas sp. (ex Botrylloides leachii)]